MEASWLCHRHGDGWFSLWQVSSFRDFASMCRGSISQTWLSRWCFALHRGRCAWRTCPHVACETGGGKAHGSRMKIITKTHFSFSFHTTDTDLQFYWLLLCRGYRHFSLVSICNFKSPYFNNQTFILAVLFHFHMGQIIIFCLNYIIKQINFVWWY